MDGDATSVRVRFVAARQGGGEVDVQGTARLAPIAADLRARVTRVDLAVWEALIPLPGRLEWLRGERSHRRGHDVARRARRAGARPRGAHPPRPVRRRAAAHRRAGARAGRHRRRVAAPAHRARPRGPTDGGGGSRRRRAPVAHGARAARGSAITRRRGPRRGRARRIGPRGGDRRGRRERGDADARRRLGGAARAPSDLALRPHGARRRMAGAPRRQGRDEGGAARDGHVRRHRHRVPRSGQARPARAARGRGARALSGLRAGRRADPRAARRRRGRHGGARAADGPGGEGHRRRARSDHRRAGATAHHRGADGDDGPRLPLADDGGGRPVPRGALVGHGRAARRRRAAARRALPLACRGLPAPASSDGAAPRAAWCSTSRCARACSRAAR